MQLELKRWLSLTLLNLLFAKVFRLLDIGISVHIIHTFQTWAMGGARASLTTCWSLLPPYLSSHRRWLRHWTNITSSTSSTQQRVPLCHMGQTICNCYWAYPSSPTSHSSVSPPLKIHQTLATPMDCVFRLLDIGIHTFELWAMGARASFTTCSSLPQQSSPMTSTLNEQYLSYKQYSAKGPTMSYGTKYMQLLLSPRLLAHQPLLREPTPKDTPNSRNTGGLRLPASRHRDTYHTFQTWTMGARASLTTCWSLTQQSSPMTSTLNE